MKVNSELVTVNYVATLLNVSQKYIYELVRQNKIPYYKPFNKRLYFKVDEVLAVVEASKVQTIKPSKQIESEAANMMLGRGKRNG
jgi:excisionase family DNA binding protein